MKRGSRIVRRTALALAAALVLVGGPSGGAQAVGYALIQGSGSSWAANAVNLWVDDVVSQGIKVVYTPNGAAQGRKDYANRNNDFGVSDSPFRGKDPSTGADDSPRGRSYAYLPVVSGGTSFPYHLEIGGKLYTKLRLSGPTIAKIFTNRIRSWSDPAITKDNNGQKLPNISIIPIVRADGAGVTNQFTTWMASQYPSIWASCNGGKAKPTDYFPLNCGRSSGPQKAQAGSDGVMNYVKAAGSNGSIAMEEYSYPLLARYPVARMLNRAGYYALPTQYNVAVALTRAQINSDKRSKDYLTQKLDRVYTNPDSRTYPLSSYVYAIIPTAKNDRRMSRSKAQSLSDFLYHSLCRGQGEVGEIGYSPLPVNLVQAGFEQIGKLRSFGVTLKNRNVSTCKNPTFIAGQPNQNYLAKIAPLPPACAKAGNDPCAHNEDAVTKNPTADGKAPGATDTTGGSGGRGGGGDGATGGAAKGGNAPGDDLGLGGGGSGGGSSGDAEVVPTTLAADGGAGQKPVLTALVVGLLLAVLVAPSAIGAVVSRGRGGRR